MPWTTLCDLSDLTEGEGRGVDIDGRQLAVFLNAGRPHVLDGICPHAGAPMGAGWVTDGCAVCPRHAWRFDLNDGKLMPFGAEGLRAYACRTIDYDGRTLVQADLGTP